MLCLLEVMLASATDKNSLATVRLDGTREESRALRRPLSGGGQARPPQQPDRPLGTSNLIGSTQHTSNRLNLAFRLGVCLCRQVAWQILNQLRGEQPLVPIDEALSAMANSRHVLVTHGNPGTIEDGA